jgi:hypothetical protein
MIMYRIFDDKNDLPHTLFRGVRGSRTLPLDTWIEAEQKMGKEGSHGKLYLTAFHVVDSLEDAINFFVKRFRNYDGRVICAVEVDGELRKKPSNNSVTLAEKMRIPKRFWDERIICNEL